MVSFARQVLESFTTLAEAQHIDLRLVAEMPRLTLVFDAGKLEEILTNLLANALRFTSRMAP